MKKTLKLQTRLTIFVCIVVLIALLITFFTVGAQTTKRIRDQEKATALQTAEMVAEAPMTAAALESGKKTKGTAELHKAGSENYRHGICCRHGYERYPQNSS